MPSPANKPQKRPREPRAPRGQPTTPPALPEAATRQVLPLLATGQAVPPRLRRQFNPTQWLAVVMTVRSMLQRRRMDSMDRMPHNPVLRQQQAQFARTDPTAGAGALPNSTQVIEALPPAEQLRVRANEALQIHQQQAAEIEANRAALARAQGRA